MRKKIRALRENHLASEGENFLPRRQDKMAEPAGKRRKLDSTAPRTSLQDVDDEIARLEAELAAALAEL